MLNLRHGVISEPIGDALQSGPIARFLKTAQDALNQETYSKLEHDPSEFSDEYTKRKYVSYLVRLLFHIREMRHGGSVIVVPDHLQADDPRLRERITIKYPCTYDRGWELLQESLTLTHINISQFWSLADPERKISEETLRAVDSVKQELDDTDEAVSDSINFIASLSGVDGAIVLTVDFAS